MGINVSRTHDGNRRDLSAKMKKKDQNLDRYLARNRLTPNDLVGQKNHSKNNLTMITIVTYQGISPSNVAKTAEEPPIIA